MTSLNVESSLVANHILNDIVDRSINLSQQKMDQMEGFHEKNVPKDSVVRHKKRFMRQRSYPDPEDSDEDPKDHEVRHKKSFFREISNSGGEEDSDDSDVSRSYSYTESDEKFEDLEDIDLILALKEKKVDTATELINRGAKCDVQVADFATPLIYACKSQKLSSIAKHLLDLQDNNGYVLSNDHINLKTKHGHSALTLAIHAQMVDTAEDLIKRGAKCDVITEDGETPLVFACAANLPSIAKQLLDLKDNDGKYVLTNDHINLKTESGNTALTYAIRTKLVDTAIELIKRGAKCDVETKDDGTPLLQACFNNLPSVAKYLLNLRNNDTYVLTKDHIDLKIECTNNGLKDGDQAQTALEWAIQQNISEVVILLLERGASLYKDGEVLRITETDMKGYLDKLVLKHEETEKKWRGIYEEKLVFNYECLTLNNIEKDDNNKRDNYDTNESRLLYDVVNLSPDHKELVKHPIVRAFLNNKWEKMKCWWLIWIMLKVVFIVLIIAMSFTKYCNNYCGAAATKNTETDKDGNIQKDIDGSNSIATFCLYGLFELLLITFSVIEIMQVATNVNAWATEAKNWIQLFILVISQIIVVNLVLSEYLPVQEKEKFDLNKFDRHCFSVLFPLAYYELLYEIGYHPLCTKYINMFNRVFKTFLSYFFVYMGLIISFAFGFFFMIIPPAEDKTSVANNTAGEDKTAAEIAVEMLKENDESNYPRSLWKLLPKVFVMFSGEQDFMNIPFDQNQTLVTLYGLFQFLFYLAFILVMVVILFNLLNGLAVRDAGEMLDSAEVDMLYSLLSIVAFWDKFLSKDKSISSREHTRPDDVESQSPRNDECKQLWVPCFGYVGGKQPAKEDCKQSGPKINFRLCLPNCFPHPDFHILNQGEKLYFKIYEKKSKSYNANRFDDTSKTYKVLDFSITQEIGKMSNEIIQSRKIQESETGSICNNDDDRWGLMLKKYISKRDELENSPATSPRSEPEPRIQVKFSQPCPKELFARALYDFYNAEEDSRLLELKKGDVIRLLFENIGGGIENCMLGELRGKTGFFPYDCVEVLTMSILPKSD